MTTGVAETCMLLDETIILRLYYALLAEQAVSEPSLWKGSAEERTVLAERLTTAADDFAHCNGIDQALAAHLRATAARLRA